MFSKSTPLAPCKIGSTSAASDYKKDVTGARNQRKENEETKEKRLKVRKRGKMGVRKKGEKSSEGEKVE